MTKQDARKITILEELLEKRITNAQAAKLLGISIRQIQRLKAQAVNGGITTILHKSRGRKPSNTLDQGVREHLVEIYKNELEGYNFCHAADVLAEEKGVYVSVSTVSRYLKAAGIHSPKAKRRPKKHRSRDARPYEGELAQMDASAYDWLSNGRKLHLHGAIDDATGRILALHLEQEETFEGYCELMYQMNRDGHVPRELYTDGRTVFFYESNRKKKLTIAEELAGMREKQPHFARAAQELGVILIIAKSAQAKGGIERLWGTLQDRLPKDLKRKGITTVAKANAFFREYISYYNRKFAVSAAKKELWYLRKRPSAEMQLIFSRQVVRKIDRGLAFSFGGRKYTLPLYCGSQRVEVSFHDPIIVATSPYIGMKVIYKDLVLDPQPLTLKDRKKRIAVNAEGVNRPRLPHDKVPTVTPFFSHTHRFLPYSTNSGG